MIRRAADIVKALLEFGTDREYGGIYYFMDVLGKPHLELQWDMKLWWPHNEATLATLFASDKNLFAEAAEHLRAALTYSSTAPAQKPVVFDTVE